jgi:hypothetical protein
MPNVCKEMSFSGRNTLMLISILYLCVFFLKTYVYQLSIIRPNFAEKKIEIDKKINIFLNKSRYNLEFKI